MKKKKWKKIVEIFRAPLKTFKLADIFAEKEESMNELINLMRDEQQGLSFVKDNVLPECSFVAIEALWWSIEHCEEIENETIAMNLFKVKAEEKSNRLIPFETVYIIFHIQSFSFSKANK